MHLLLAALHRGVGRQPIYVDLEAEPKIDRDNPPDLKQHADSIELPPKEDQDASGSSSSAPAGAAAAASAKPAAAGKASKKAAAVGGGAGKAAGKQSNDEHHIKLTNVVQRTGDIIDMVGV